MAISPFNTDTAQGPWNTLVLGDLVFPGILLSLVPSITYDYDVKKAKDRDKAYVAYTGTKARTINATLLLYSEEQYQKFITDIVPDFNVKANGGVNAPFTITHPQCEIWGIRQVVVTSISPGMPNSSGGWPIAIGLLEYVAAQPPRARSRRQVAPQSQPTPGNRRSLGGAVSTDPITNEPITSTINQEENDRLAALALREEFANLGF